MNTSASRQLYARQREIRAELRAQYRAGAVNEMVVAKLRHEMSSLPHTHEWMNKTAPRGEWECAWCFSGTDAYNQTWKQIERETREHIAALDAATAKALAPLTTTAIARAKTVKGD